jgi:hypothetical protein
MDSVIAIHADSPIFIVRNRRRTRREDLSASVRTPLEEESLTVL